jgi:hypothetical protein
LRSGSPGSNEVPPPAETIGRFVPEKFWTRKARSSSCDVGENLVTVCTELVNEAVQSELQAIQPAEPVCFQNLGWLRVSCRHSNVTQEPGRTSTSNLRPWIGSRPLLLGLSQFMGQIWDWDKFPFRGTSCPVPTLGKLRKPIHRFENSRRLISAVQEIVSRLAGKESVFPAGKVFPPGTKVGPFAIRRRCAIRLHCAIRLRSPITPREVLVPTIENSNGARFIPLLSHPFSKHE